MKKPKAAPPKTPSKLKARDMATEPSTVRGTPSKSIPALDKPPSQVTQPKQGLNNQAIGNQRPANSAAANNQAQRPAAVTNNRNTPAVTGGRPNTPAAATGGRPNTPAAGTRANAPAATAIPRLTPELVDTNNNQQAAPVQTALPVAPSAPVVTPSVPAAPLAPVDSQFSSAIEKLKENVQQGDTQP